MSTSRLSKPRIDKWTPRMVKKSPWSMLSLLIKQDQPKPSSKENKLKKSNKELPLLLETVSRKLSRDTFLLNLICLVESLPKLSKLNLLLIPRIFQTNKSNLNQDNSIEDKVDKEEDHSIEEVMIEEEDKEDSIIEEEIEEMMIVEITDVKIVTMIEETIDKIEEITDKIEETTETTDKTEEMIEIEETIEELIEEMTEEMIEETIEEMTETGEMIEEMIEEKTEEATTEITEITEIEEMMTVIMIEEVETRKLEMVTETTDHVVVQEVSNKKEVREDQC